MPIQPYDGYATGSSSGAASSLNMKSASVAVNTAISATDNGKVITTTSQGITLTLAALSSLGEGFTLAVKNTSSGNVTIATTGADTIDGGSSFVIPSKEVAFIQSNGVVAQVVSLNNMKMARLPIFQDNGTWDAVSLYEDLVVTKSQFNVVSDFASPAAAATACAGKRLFIGDGETVTLNVPSAFATTQAAWDAISQWVISNKGNVIIQHADGTYTLGAGVSLNHPFGRRIQVLGNVTTPDNCVITVAGAPTFDAFVVSNGAALGLLDGFKFDLASKAGQANNATAVLALNGGEIICGSHIKTNNWYYGIAARHGSYIYAPNAVVNNAGDIGIWAFVGSTVDAPGATSTNASDSANGLGFGFQAEYGSTVDCSGGTASGCYKAGVAALSGSTVRALNGTNSSSNTGSGFLAQDGGFVECHGATANNNTRYGVEEVRNGRAYYASITATGNTIAARAPVVLTDTTSGQARVYASSGPMRYDTVDTSPHYFNTSGGLQFQVTHTANAVNSVKATGAATGAQPGFYADGSDTNVGMCYDTKGSGSHYWNTGGGCQFEVFNTVNSVNFLAATGAATGSAPRIQATGNDTDIDVYLSPKAAGLVRFGTFTAGSDVPIVGYKAVKNSDGSTCKLAVIA